MRLLKVYIDGFRNLKDVEIDFDKESLTTVIIGQNGSGKSNLIEAIVEIFEAYDRTTKRITHFQFQIDYEMRGTTYRLSNMSGHSERLHGRDGMLECVVLQNGEEILRLQGAGKAHLPDLIFGYYSGSSRRLEKLFDPSQSRYYGVINKECSPEEYELAREARRLFYCRPVHGVFTLLAYFAKPGHEQDVRALLTEKLGITGFHSALAHFKEPSWFSHDRWQKIKFTSEGLSSRGRRTYDKLEEQSWDLWGALGPAGRCGRALRDLSFHPFPLAGKIVEDYRQKARTESQLACFLRDNAALSEFASNYESDQDLFAALEAADISDLFREMIVWVKRANDLSGDVSYSDLSDGERQLLMVLGLIRVSRGKEALFLLDEPDTHLNPAWQLTYLDLIKEWTEVAADEDKCQIIMTSHNPLTIAALSKEEVRVMWQDEDQNVHASPPYVDPKGLGFTATLTEVFGLPTTLDPETQGKLDERDRLAAIHEKTDQQQRDLSVINDKLDRLGFLLEDRDPDYQGFLRVKRALQLDQLPQISPDQLVERDRQLKDILSKLLADDKGAVH
jgi:ABC-type cobalamin/Fe3+-siderophores transport system ATPase subunit